MDLGDYLDIRDMKGVKRSQEPEDNREWVRRKWFNASFVSLYPMRWAQKDLVQSRVESVKPRPETRTASTNKGVLFAPQKGDKSRI